LYVIDFGRSARTFDEDPYHGKNETRGTVDNYHDDDLAVAALRSRIKKFIKSKVTN